MSAGMNYGFDGKDISLMLEQNTPLLPDHELHSFVEYYFKRGHEYLSVLREHQSPCYLLDKRQLKKRAGQFMAAFKDCLSDVAFYYAVKSNNHPDIARILMQLGIGLDVSSGPELEMALKIKGDDIVFSGPGKTDAELHLAVENSDRVVILVDSFGELSRLETITSLKKKYIRIGVRLTTNPKGLWRKFGILPEKLSLFMEKVGCCPFLCFQGIQFHTSWNLTPNAQVEFIRLLGNVLSTLPNSVLKQIEFVDIGGGYWPSSGEWLQVAGTAAGKLRGNLGLEQDPVLTHYYQPALSITSFSDQLAEAVKKYILKVVNCRICLEPGRWLSNDAMHLLLSVVDKKADDLVITDAGTNAVGWERFETDYFPVLNLSRPAIDEKPCNILGSLCTPHDVWGYGYWGEDIQVGDILLIPTQGAYTYSLRQNFIKSLPEVVMIE